MATDIKIDKITPTIGADVSGVDLNTLDDDTFALVHAALLDRGVLAFRDQDLDPEAHLAFARRFGDIDQYPFKKGNAHFSPHPDGVEGLVRLEHDEKHPGYENQWHIDMTWRAEPPLGSILKAIELPASGGGDTMFSSLGAAYESMDEHSQQLVANCTQDHDWLKVFGRNLDPAELGAFRADLPMVNHPAVRTHPDTGRKGLFVNEAFGIGLRDLPQVHARQWLSHLYGVIATPEFHCRIKWEPGTVVMWDNRAVAHYAVNDYYPERRVMERVTVAGDKPF